MAEEQWRSSLATLQNTLSSEGELLQATRVLAALCRNAGAKVKCAAGVSQDLKTTCQTILSIQNEGPLTQAIDELVRLLPSISAATVGHLDACHRSDLVDARLIDGPWQVARSAKYCSLKGNEAHCDKLCPMVLDVSPPIALSGPVDAKADICGSTQADMRNSLGDGTAQLAACDVLPVCGVGENGEGDLELDVGVGVTDVCNGPDIGCGSPLMLLDGAGDHIGAMALDNVDDCVGIGDPLSDGGYWKPGETPAGSLAAVPAARA